MQESYQLGLRDIQRRRRIRSVFTLILLLLGVFLLSSYQVQLGEGGQIQLTMVYGSEKRGWIEEATPLFLDWWRDTYPGIQLELNVSPLGSRESMIQIITGEIKPIVWSPASSVWIPLANWMWAREYEEITFIEDYESLVFSPVVIASWKSYVSRQGIRGFRSLHQLATMERSDLRFAHTNPQLSNSGFMAVIMEIAVAAGKKPSELTVEDLLSEDVRSWLMELESAAVHYGQSTGFLVDEAVEGGPESLNALVIYENLILEKNLSGEPQARWGDSLVAVYPEEGMLLSDHPFCVLNAPWVSEEQKWAAEEFLRFLLTPEIQAKAVGHGFRPTTPGVELDKGIFNPENGVSYLLPVAVLSSPTDGEVLWHITDIWSTARARG